MKFFKRSKKKKKNSASEYFSDNDSEKSVSLKKRLSNIFKTKKPEKSSSFAQNPPSKQPKTTITSFQTKNTPSESTTERNHSHFHPNPAKIDFNQINSDENPFLRKPSSPNHDIANRKNLANLDSDKTKQNLANLNKTKFGQNIETLNFLNSLSKHYKWSVLVARKAKTGDTRSIVIICSFLSCILIFMGCLQPFIHALSACAYPAYMSFKALKTETQEDDRKWLVYWTVYGIIRITETILYPLIKNLPYFVMFELCFLVWLYHDSTNGADLLYTKYLKPALERHEASIDKGLKTVDSSQFIKGVISNDVS